SRTRPRARSQIASPRTPSAATARSRSAAPRGPPTHDSFQSTIRLLEVGQEARARLLVEAGARTSVELVEALRKPGRGTQPSEQHREFTRGIGEESVGIDDVDPI